jgi:hypothetical protein
LPNVDEFYDFKRLKTGDEKWAKIDKLIKRKETELILFEVPKGVNFIHINLFFSI